MKDQKQYILANFNFEHVHKAMRALKWGWASSGGETPTMGQLYQCAERLLDEAAEKPGDYYVGIGGFVVRKDDGILSLAFEVDEWDGSNIVNGGRQ